MTADARRAPPREAPLDVEALTVAMALAPGVYSRNRLYDLFDASPARAARRRAAVLRGLARQLASHRDVEIVTSPRDEGGIVVTYRIAALKLTRTLDLTDVERAVILHLTSNTSGASSAALLPTTSHDRALVHSALARLGPALAPPPGAV